MAVLPSAERDTQLPWLPFTATWPPAPVPTNLFPCWAHDPPLRVKIQTAPTPALSEGPPTIAVLLSADMATERPCAADPTAPDPTNLFPCWDQTPPLLVQTHTAPT